MKKKKREVSRLDPREQLVVALDVGGLDEARAVVRGLGDAVLWYKVGLELFGAAGPEAVQVLKREGKKVFLDLKLHDIPNTVARAASRLATVGADLLDMHTSAGSEAMAHAAQALRAHTAAEARPLLLGVTVLTSSKQLAAGGGAALTREALLEEAGRRAVMAKDAGLDGVVAPAAALLEIRERCGSDFRVLVPGIRPAGAAHGDQQWTATPAQAVAAGACWIVVGRPITSAPEPAAAAHAILAEMQAAEFDEVE